MALLAAATTGPDGLAVIDAVTADELSYVDVHSREFGIQGRPIVPQQGKPPVISLRPVSVWRGRLSAAEPKHLAGWHVKAWTRIGGDPNGEPATTGYVETTPDNEGRFALAPIAIGALQLQLKPPGDVPVLADIPRSLAVHEGREESVDIPLKLTPARGRPPGWRSRHFARRLSGPAAKTFSTVPWPTPTGSRALM